MYWVAFNASLSFENGLSVARKEGVIVPVIAAHTLTVAVWNSRIGSGYCSKIRLVFALYVVDFLKF